MAKATPVSAQAEKPEAPAAAEDKLMAPVAEAAKAAESVDRAELEALVAEAEAEGKRAVIVGNAVRVDH